MQRPLAAIRLAAVPAFKEDDLGYEEHIVPAECRRLQLW